MQGVCGVLGPLLEHLGESPRVLLAGELDTVHLAQTRRTKDNLVTWNSPVWRMLSSCAWPSFLGSPLLSVATASSSWKLGSTNRSRMLIVFLRVMEVVEVEVESDWTVMGLEEMMSFRKEMFNFHVCYILYAFYCAYFITVLQKNFHV